MRSLIASASELKQFEGLNVQADMMNPASNPRGTGGVQRRGMFLRIIVLICSIMLVGTYLAYEMGRSIFPSTKSGRIAPQHAADDEPTPPASQPVRTLMPGSKSSAVFDSVEDVVYEDGSVERANPFAGRVFPGSKSGSPLIRPRDPVQSGGETTLQPSTQPDADQTPDR